MRHAPTLFWGEMEKFGPAFKSIVQIGLNPKNHVYSSNGMAVTEMSIFTVLGQKGGMPPPLFLGGGGNFGPAFKSNVQN